MIWIVNINETNGRSLSTRQPTRHRSEPVDHPCSFYGRWRALIVLSGQRIGTERAVFRVTTHNYRYRTQRGTKR